jgi:5-methylthioadenosine/S-adenosylhomocysteine deaminase
VAVAHCPASNAKLGSGVARVPELLGLGVRVGLGTDGPASADGLELFEGMRLAARFARALAADPAAMTTHQALELATRSGAAALGLDVGVLEPGRQADVVRLELDDGSFTPALNASNLLGHLVWAATSRLVTDVWVGGDQVVAGGISTHIDASRVRSEVQRRARRIAEAAGH